MRRSAAVADDRGVYAVLYAVLVVVLVMVAALVVDLSGMRVDRRIERSAADSAATAGALHLNPLDGTYDANAACVEAWDYIRFNLPGAGSAVPACSSSTFPAASTSCPATSLSQSGPAGDWTVTITWPIPNDDPSIVGDSPLLEEPDVTGRGSYIQPYVEDIDGKDPCERMAVTVSRTHGFMLAGVGGFSGATTSNTSVARAHLRGDFKQEFPLVVLDQHGCNVILVQGAGPQDSVVRVLNNGITPGRIAVDSRGDEPGQGAHGCDNSNDYVADVDGGGRIQAYDGSGGSPGRILRFAPTAKFANPTKLCALGADPATTADGTICPRSTPFDRLTRKFWDWQYHCSATIVEPYSAPCPDATATPPTPDHISGLQNTLGTLTESTAVAAGFTVWPATFDDPAVCDYTATNYLYKSPGNYYINCSTFNVNRVTVFGGGTLVFRGGLQVKNTGTGQHCLVLNQPVGVTPPALVDFGGSVGINYPVCVPTSASVTPAPLDDMIVFIQNGDLTRQNADFIAPQTLLYQEANPAKGGCRTCRIDLGAGTSSNLLITGPQDNEFKNLAIWSENTAGVDNAESQANQLGSQNKLGLEGILFLPRALVNFGGNPTYLGSARAQFVSWRLSVAGGGSLELVPDPETTLTIPVGGVLLIR